MMKFILFSIYVCLGFLIGIIAVKKAQVSVGIFISIQLFWIIWAFTLLFLIVEDFVYHGIYKFSNKEYLIEFKDVHGTYEDIQMNLKSKMSRRQLADYLEVGDHAVNLYLKQLGLTLKEGEPLEIEYRVFDKKDMPGVKVEQKRPKRKRIPKKKLVF